VEGGAGELAEVKKQLEEARKELSLAHQRPSGTARRPDRPNGNPPPAAARTPSGAASRSASAQTQHSGQAATTRLYETTRATSVYEGPSQTSRVITRIEPGTRINVASAAAGWLEVRSRRGNPPGYVRADDARPIGML
jgi:hypothetical protein